MTIEAVLFDLDDTLIVDDRTIEEALARVCLAWCPPNAQPSELADALRCSARALWTSLPSINYCRRMGISSWEGLCSTFPGEQSELGALRSLAPQFRLSAWSGALDAVGVPPGHARGELAEALAQAFMHERRREYVVYPDVVPALQALRGRVRLGLVTNGPGDLQREKLARTGLEAWFGAVAVSSEVGAGKPEPSLFHHALATLGARPDAAVMVGDAPERDVAGARACGMKAVLVERGYRRERAQSPEYMPSADVPADHKVSDLSELVDWLDDINR